MSQSGERTSFKSRALRLLRYLPLVAMIVGLPPFTWLLFSSRAGERWDLEGARLHLGRGEAALLVHLRSGARRGESNASWLAALALEDGRELGRIKGDSVSTLGVGAEHIWVQRHGLRKQRWTAYWLPELQPRYELAELLRQHRLQPQQLQRVIPVASSGHLKLLDRKERWHLIDPSSGELTSLEENRWEEVSAPNLAPPRCDGLPRPPRVVDGELMLEGAFICDHDSGGLLELPGGDRLLAYQDLEGDTGKLVIGRLTGDARWVWRFTEQERLGPRPAEAHGYRVGFAALHKSHVVLVLPQAKRDGDAWALSVNTTDGAQRWAQRFE